MIKFTVKNAEQAKRALSTFSKEFNDKVLFNVHRAAGNLIKKELSAAAPEGINTKRSKSKLKATTMVAKAKDSKTGVWVGFSKKGFAALFLEKGTTQRTTSGNSKKYKRPANRGRMAPRPFVHATYRRSLKKVVDFISNNYYKIVTKAIRKYGKK
jgi:hypothetical protein